MKNPCYDDVSKKDCPKRHVGCAIDCPEWLAYTKQREEMYRRRAVECESRAVVFGTANDNVIKRKRKDIWIRQNKTRRR